MTPEMMKAGMALLDWDTGALADRAGVTRATVSRYLNGGPDNSLPKMVAAFAAHGVTFKHGRTVPQITRTTPPPSKQ